MNDKIYRWQELELQSLDLILCAGDSDMSRRIQKFQRLTGAPEEGAGISHVAGVVTMVYSTDPYIQESTTLNKWAGKAGVQENPMRVWLPKYDGKVYVRKLDFTRFDTFLEADDVFWSDHMFDPYESGIPGNIELLLCAMRLHRFVPWYTPIETKELHCTELIAKRLQCHGLLSDDEPTNRLPPWYWVSEIDEMLRCDVSELIRIK